MHDLLSLWVGPQFANEATWTAQLIAICFATRGAFPVYMEFLKGTGRIRYLSLAFAGTSLVGVVLAFPLCGYFGLPGAGYRAILLSWAGFAILIAVWTMLLQRRLREIVALIIEPLGVAAALAPFMLWARARVGATSFCGVIGMWIMFAVGLGTALAAVNWAFRRHNGSFARLIGEVLSNRIECRRFAQHEPESSDVGASELHGVQ
jgi:O-antigen/teichoic acid export membrane protein